MLKRAPSLKKGSGGRDAASSARGAVFGQKNIRFDAFRRSGCFSQHKVFGPIEFQNNLGSRTPSCSKYLVHSVDSRFGLLATRRYEFHELSAERICWSLQLKALGVYGFRCARKNHRHSLSSGTQLTS